MWKIKQLGVVALSWHIAWNYVNMASCNSQPYSIPQKKVEIIFHEMFSKDKQHPILLRLRLSSLLNFVNIGFSKWHSRFFHLSIQIEPLVTMKCMKNTSLGSYDLECSGIFIFKRSLAHVVRRALIHLTFSRNHLLKKTKNLLNLHIKQSYITFNDSL